MIETCVQMQARVQNMRDALLTEGSVVPEEGYVITSLETKKKVLWYLDRVAAAVAGAHRHLSNMEHDDLLSATEKAERQEQIIERLGHELGWLPCTIRDLEYCMDEHAEEYEAWELQIHGQTLEQLNLLDQKVCDMFHALEADVT